MIFPSVFCFHARFTAITQTDLKEPLRALGLTDMFDPLKANFAKISSTFSLKLVLKLEGYVTN